MSLLGEGQAKLLDLPGLAAFLTAHGRPATVLDGRPPDLGWSERYVLRVAGSPIDRVSLQMKGVVGPRRNLGRGAFMVGVGVVPMFGRMVLPVQTHLLLDTEHDPGAAKLVWETEGFFKKERTGLHWQGGPLAAALDADEAVRDGCWNDLGPDDGLWVRPEPGRIRVVLRRDLELELGVVVPGLSKAHRAAWTPELLHLLERVAAHARGWIGG